ncbi:MAG TPA: hypothetical protein VF829_01850 [Candidatus Paceibacterota bacterium]
MINPLYNFFSYLLPVALLLAFVPRAVFKSATRFAALALPLAFLHIATMPVSSYRLGINPFPFPRDDAARLDGTLIATAIFIIIAYGLVRTRRYAHALKQGGEAYAERDTQDTSILFSATLAATMTAAISLAAITNTTSVSLDTLLILLLVSILANVYTFFAASYLSHRRWRLSEPFGRKLNVSWILLGFDVLAFALQLR